MILVDTSVWIDHLRENDPALSALLGRRQILTHPFVIGELALGRVDGFDQDHGAGESDYRAVAVGGFLATHGDAFEAL